METIFYSLASKKNFNKSLNHFFSVNEIVDELEAENNLADIIDRNIDLNLFDRVCQDFF